MLIWASRRRYASHGCAHAAPFGCDGRHLKTKPVETKELEKAKNQMMKSWVDSMKTVHGKSNLLALNEVVTGSYENTFDDLEKYKKVTKEDILRVAKKYFTKENRTIVVIVPQKASKTEKTSKAQKPQKGGKK